MSQLTLKKNRRLRTGPGSAERLMTIAQFDGLRGEFAGRNRYELINGVLVVPPRADIGERSPNNMLGYLIQRYAETVPEGSTIYATAPKQTVPATNRRYADRVIWTALGRASDERTDIPSIIIEFVSKQRHDALLDYELKRDEYLAAGAKEYWVIDRFRRIMAVYRQGAAGPANDIVTEAQTCQTHLLPGYVLPLSRLSQTDQWQRKPARSKPTTRKPNAPAGGTDG